MVTSHVDAEIIDPRSRGILDGFIEDGRVATLRINTGREIREFQRLHRGMDDGETDVVLACRKIALDGGSARGVLDDLKGRAAARKAGIEFTGLIGLLGDLGSRGILGEREYGEIVRDLKHSKFRLPRNF